MMNNGVYSRSDVWDERFLDMASLIATWSKDPSSKIGCVVIDPTSRRVLSIGYNGFPRGIVDSWARYQVREKKYEYIVHAEQNAIYNATANGVQLSGSTLYCSGLPTCSECAKALIQVGIKRVVCRSAENERWAESWALTKSMFDEVGIEYTLLNDRNQSIGS